MNIDVLDIKKCEYDKLIYGDYKIFEKRVRRINMEEKWIKEMIDNDKWKFIM
tara:strand:- start:126 stop:281 length:156 start_codon:yes stop_codon:yes gene_type:complete